MTTPSPLGLCANHLRVEDEVPAVALLDGDSLCRDCVLLAYEGKEGAQAELDALKEQAKNLRPAWRPMPPR